MAMKSKPLIVFIFSKEGSSTSTRYGGFAHRLKEAGNFPNAETLTCALENLIYIIKEDKSAEVIDTVSGRCLSESSFVYFKSWTSMADEAAALAHFLTGRSIPFADTLVLGKGTSKLTTLFKLWSNSILVPQTVYAPKTYDISAAIEAGGLKFPMIVKDASGQKGRLNFLCKNKADLTKILRQYPYNRFIVQRYIPSDGDLRIGVYGGVVRIVIGRSASGKSHLNNTSQGAIAKYMPISKLSPKIRSLAVRAARAADLEIAGVDIIIDKNSSKAYVLEVNQGSQIVTGSFVKRKKIVFNQALSELVKHRYAKTRPQPIELIGRRAKVKLPELGVELAIAKLDTGAYTSSLHVENIQVKKTNGKNVLHFDMAPTPKLNTADGKTHHIATTDYFIQAVRSSTGHTENRFSIQTPMIIANKRVKVTLTLTKRDMMGYPILVGRRIIRSRFLVNVELNEDNDARWTY